MDSYESLGAVIAGLLVIIIIAGIIGTIISIVTLIANWKYFKKAGKPGWACLIPYYVNYVNCQIGGTKTLWFIITVVGSLVGYGSATIINSTEEVTALSAIIGLLSAACSIMSLVALIIIMHNVFKSFGYGGGMTVLFVFVPIIPIWILGFGKCTYLGEMGTGNVPVAPPGAAPTAANAPPEMSKVCPNCGHAVQPGESFCTNCGAKF